MHRAIRTSLCELLLVLSALGGIADRMSAQEPAAPARRLTLPQAVALALENNRDVLLAQVAVSRAEADHREARSVFHPQILLGSGLAATRGFPLSIEGSAPSIFQVASSQALWNRSLKNVAHQAGQMRVAAEKSLEEKRDEMVARTVQTYLELDRSRRSLEHAGKQTESLVAAEQIVRERVEAGLEPPLETTRASLNVARSRSRFVELENRIALLEFTLRDLTGLPQSEAIQVEPAEVPVVRPADTVEQWVERALGHNQGLRALEEEIRAREFRVRSEQATRWPRVNLIGQYGLFSDINNYSQFFQRFARHNATFGISVVIPVFERDRYLARLSKAEADLAAARYRLDAARSALAREVRERWGEIEQQTAGREVARLELELSRRSLDAALAQFEEGRVNRLAVEQARLRENESWVSFFQADYQAEQARLEMLRLTGEIRSVFP